MVDLNTMHFEFNGSSMLPTLKPGDRLVVACGGVVHVGDVVVFQLHEKLYIAHRVVSVGSRGIITRGDNVNNNDVRILQPHEITGKVLSAQRGTRTIVIRGGSQGMLYIRIILIVKQLTNNLALMFSPAYQTLSRSGIFLKVLPACARPRVVYFNRQGGLEMQLLLGRLVIGRRMPNSDKWQFRRPFRLFVDESKLPM